MLTCIGGYICSSDYVIFIKFFIRLLCTNEIRALHCLSFSVFHNREIMISLPMRPEVHTVYWKISPLKKTKNKKGESEKKGKCEKKRKDTKGVVEVKIAKEMQKTPKAKKNCV
jgi:hypothetical protein